jgi:hypothetical protein
VSTPGGIIPLSPSLFRASRDNVVSSREKSENILINRKKGCSLPMRAALSWMRIEDGSVVEEVDVVEGFLCGELPLIF